ncbi:MAG: hypothetical protein JO132_02355 [Streptosporangiaceae bacterium]|nr:hypothetical protein [Streptosporangiaceae bacterium]
MTDQRPDALPRGACQLQVIPEVRAGRPRVAQARAGQPGTCLIGVPEQVRAGVRFPGVDERLHQEQRHRRQLVLDMGSPRRQRHADQASRDDHRLRTV